MDVQTDVCLVLINPSIINQKVSSKVYYDSMMYVLTHSQMNYEQELSVQLHDMFRQMLHNLFFKMVV